MNGRRALQLGALLWAFGGFAVAGAAFDGNADARLLVGAATVLGPLAAVATFVQLGRGSVRGSGALLVVSAVVTPTYMAYVLNLLPLLAGIWLLGSRRALSPS